MNLQEKFEKLCSYLSSLESAAVAFSGGVDSTLLLKVAHDVLGDKSIAVTASSLSFPERELNEAKDFCTKNGISQIIFESEELDIDGFKMNPKNRCYLCKKELFTKILQLAKEYNIKNVIEGSNLDDLGDYRPGLQAITELEIKSPLRFAELTKKEIRELSQNLGLKTWNKPSFACLASRFVYGEEITREKLKMVSTAEDLLMKLGFKQFRVRLHGGRNANTSIARIEILPEDFEKIFQEDTREKIYNELKNLGFSYVTLDLKGYRTGSMNEQIR
ncbi:MAG: ATP-dependent sacrificial sulfur transferase LarE [Synergistaceae bacterium]|nr:ATP-dependent sacrificial sulfur transferase LarE [Synergistaceae bacterium]